MDQPEDKRLLGVEGQTETRKRKTHALEINQKELFTLFQPPLPPFFMLTSLSLAVGHRILRHLTLCQFFLASFQEDQNICSRPIKSKKERRWCVAMATTPHLHVRLGLVCP